jgi:hypothetical protein
MHPPAKTLFGEIPMTTESKAAATGAAALAVVSTLTAAEATSIHDLVDQIKSKDDKIRGPAWQNAGQHGATAVKPLAELMSDSDMETARSAKRALWQIVRDAGRPGAKSKAGSVSAALLPLLSIKLPAVQREALWMLSEIAGNEAVAPMAALLSDPQLREDARCALTRLPGAKAISALQAALRAAPPDFQPAIAHSLRVRGEKVVGNPSQKLVPTRKTKAAQ